jgi:methylase of polypeptide subunit release factors
MEIGADQGVAVKQLFSEDNAGEQHFDLVEVLPDYTGRDRVLHTRKMQL